MNQDTTELKNTTEAGQLERRVRPIMWCELKLDCYDGPNCDQHRKYWDGYSDGDKQGEVIGSTITLDIKTFPPGTKVVVSVPICPACFETCETCQCGFDWKQWAENEYA